MIKLGSANAGSPCTVRIAVLAKRYDIEADFSDVLADGIEVREFKWRAVSVVEVEIANINQGRKVELPFDTYYSLEDGIDNCAGSDLWLIVSDRLEKPLAPIRPYVVFATDYIQRYVPEIFPDDMPDVDLPFFQTARQANGVIVTTPQTGEDAISYAGIPRSNVHLAPMDFDPTAFSGVDDLSGDHQPYIVWPTNTAQHKNHVRALDALEIYYNKLGGGLRVKVVGPFSEWMNPKAGGPKEILEIKYIADLRSKIKRSHLLTSKIDFLGEVSDDLYASIVSHASFLWHPTIIDNGTFAVAEAAWLGTPSLSSGYPQMRYIGERFSIPMEYFNAHSVEAMAKALRSMEENASAVRSVLPSRELLETHSWQNYSGEYWDMLQGVGL